MFCTSSCGADHIFLERAPPASLPSCKFSHVRRRIANGSLAFSCNARKDGRAEASVAENSASEAHSRRTSLILAALTMISSHAHAEEELVLFENKQQKYRLQRPQSWDQVNKAGADALFKAANVKSTDIGVTVNAIKINRLDQLGDVKAAGERLLAAEKKKESTKSIEMLDQSATTAPSGTPFYNFDYTISTTRGDKRIISAVAVADRNLYIINGSIRCDAETCKESTPLLETVRRSVKSFDIVQSQSHS